MLPHRFISYVAMTNVAAVDWKLDPQQAAALPNFGSRSGTTGLERGSSMEAPAPKLRALGHDVALMEPANGVRAIQRTTRHWRGGADPRREGVARGN